MAFIRHKFNNSGTVSYHVVQTFREGARVRHKTLASLGESPTIAAKIEELKSYGELIQELGDKGTSISELSLFPEGRKLMKQYLDSRAEERKLKAIQEATGLP